MSEPIRILLVDDQQLMRDGLRTLLELEDDLVVSGEAEEGEAAIQQALTTRPDVILMDVRMAGMDGVEATRRLRTAWPEVRIIILTTFDDDEYIFEGLRAGAVGYLLKAISGQALADAIRKVHNGGALIDPNVARKVVSEFARIVPPVRPASAALTESLSAREYEVLRLLARGLSNREIAQQLFLAEGTVKNYVTILLQKIGVRDRTQAALYARELGLLA